MLLPNLNSTRKVYNMCAGVFVIGMIAILSVIAAAAQTSGSIRVGEKLTYNISFENYANAGYAETYTASQGKLADREAYELRSKFKTLNFLSAIHPVDESRTTFIAADSGLPLYTKISLNDGVFAKESTENFVTSPTQSFDVLAMIWRIRAAGGSGTFLLQEAQRSYSVTATPTGTAKVKTDAGEFDAIVAGIQSDFLTELGLRDVRLLLSNDEVHLPVQLKFRSAKGEITISLASIQIDEPDAPATAQTPTPMVPKPMPPRPIATPTPYIDNQPLGSDLPFTIGESLQYAVTSGGRPAGAFKLEVKERKLVDGADSLLLVGQVTAAEPGSGLFSIGDGARVYVDPQTLVPRSIELRFSGAMAGLTETARFSESTGSIITSRAQQIEAPVGTHSILSLLYAVRSFNLKPSKDLTNPVNDTRVAVYWDSKPHIFTMRPSKIETLTIQGQPVLAQMIAINTGNDALDRMGLRLWLGNDERRLPLRIVIGTFQADLVSELGSNSK